GVAGMQHFLPIGRAMANTQVYLLDRYLHPVPQGVPGEIYIGGVGVARGYLKRPGLTAERFIAHPFDTGRLYKSGDLARYLPDGTLEFLGRLDTQVKLRGFRIELGEIEFVLGQHPAVRETAVVVREEPGGDRRLIAYVVCTDQLVPEADVWRHFLRDKLPEYMVPAVFVSVEALPLTPNGKVDRRALPAPDASRLAAAVTYEAPRTETEEMLATIWGEVLSLERVGIHDDFFALGGHSLLATQVLTRIQAVRGVRLPMQALFSKTTIAGLAELVETLSTSLVSPSAEVDEERETGEI
ncbi:MAG: AMP-binding protein, partial [Candidatus Tectomicrobia bacterium]|nr:AMP-binding protein [Candidatus Tectomicrobia bacterium]